MTDEELRKLLVEATPGPWKVCETTIHGKKYGGCWIEGPDVEDDDGRMHGVLVPITGTHGSKSYTTRIVDRQDHDYNDTNARLIAAAPDLAAEVLRLRAALAAAEAERDRLTAEVEKANNEFGSQTAAWPDLWRRIAQLKDESNSRWLRAEAAEAALAAAPKLEAVAALVDAVEEVDRFLSDPLDPDDVECAWEVAKAALAAYRAATGGTTAAARDVLAEIERLDRKGGGANG